MSFKSFEQTINSYLKIEGKKKDEKERKYTEPQPILTAVERKCGSDMVITEATRKESRDRRELEKCKLKTKEREREIQILYF